MKRLFRMGLLHMIATVFFLAWAPREARCQIDVKLPNGFTITKVAGDELATNIFCMALNSNGQPVVSGPGYIKSLLDSDRDGVFDEAKVYADAPATGAQGMLFEGKDLLFTGDAGLLLFTDADGDGTADGRPQTIMPIKTGGEHTAHAVRRGPDGWLYLIAGNQTPILTEYFNGQNSPVKNPEAGFLMRLSPDFKTREIVAHGFRNAYDFDFNPAGEIFTYDSDGERDITLPWYRPTRVFQVAPGDHAGWISEGWKRPSNYFDMPTEIGALGRGSPTGVCCYQGDRFPREYRDSIFVADWTFGRIVVFQRDFKTRKYDRGNDFAISQGQFGFAVTDLVVARDGSLLVCVGGRGTEGGVYRISYMSTPTPDLKMDATEGAKHRADERVLPIRSSTGRNWNQADYLSVLSALTMASDELRIAAMETLVGRRDYLKHLKGMQWLLNFNLKTNLFPLKTTQSRLAFNIINSWPDDLINEMCENLRSEKEADLLIRIAGSKQPAERATLLIDCLTLLNTPSVNRELVLRLAQLTMGGCGPGEKVPPVFHGYTPRQPLEFTSTQQESLVAALDSLYELFKSDRASRQELLRLMAMVGDHLPKDVEFDPPSVKDITEEIHWLISAARVQARFPRHAIMRSLLGLNVKVAKQNKPTDLNWTRRIQELAKRLVENYEISGELVESDDFGRPEHVYLHDAVSDEWKSASTARFEDAIADDPATATLEQLRIVTSDPDTLNRELIRLCAEHPHLRDEAVLALAANPNAEEVELYKSGLTSFNVNVVKRSAIALRRVLEQPDDDVPASAFRAASRLGWDKQSVSVRDQLMWLLQEQSGQQFGYVPKSADTIQNEVLDAWRNYLLSKHPDDARLKVAASTAWMDVLERVDWSSGDLDRGRELYQKQQCALCHNGGSRLGPRLEGITNRFSKPDLFRAIVMPHEQVSDRYRAIIVQTTDGLIYNGTIIYESADGITLMERSGKTVRINRADIEDRVDSDKSLMPAGLLEGLNASGYADLFAFLKSQTALN